MPPTVGVAQLSHRQRAGQCSECANDQALPNSNDKIYDIKGLEWLDLPPTQRRCSGRKQHCSHRSG
jgi:hypothetical protein